MFLLFFQVINFVFNRTVLNFFLYHVYFPLGLLFFGLSIFYFYKLLGINCKINSTVLIYFFQISLLVTFFCFRSCCSFCFYKVLGLNLKISSTVLKFFPIWSPCQKMSKEPSFCTWYLLLGLLIFQILKFLPLKTKKDWSS